MTAGNLSLGTRRANEFVVRGIETIRTEIRFRRCRPGMPPPSSQLHKNVLETSVTFRGQVNVNDLPRSGVF